jgi:hypothetical protein
MLVDQVDFQEPSIHLQAAVAVLAELVETLWAVEMVAEIRLAQVVSEKSIQ